MFPFREEVGHMNTIGIKVFRDNLSKYLNLVKDGEILYVKEKNAIIAEIRKPAFSENERVTKLESFLKQEEAKGSVIRAENSSLDLSSLMRKRKAKSPIIFDWKKNYRESRKDRF